MKYLNTLIKGFLAGISIALGGWIFLRTNVWMPNIILGALFFSMGLILICNFGFYLYTGKICYLIEDKSTTYLNKVIDLLLGLLGNFLGTLVVGAILNYTFKSSSDALFENLKIMVNNKLAYTPIKMIILSFFCGMLVYIAVEGFKKIDNNFGKYVVLVLSIGGFIIMGFEHSIANMFYYFVNGVYSLDVFISILLCVLGNSLGGLFIPTLLMIKK